MHALDKVHALHASLQLLYLAGSYQMLLSVSCSSTWLVVKATRDCLIVSKVETHVPHTTLTLQFLAWEVKILINV